MKILYTNFHEGDGGGQTTYISSLCKALKNKYRVAIAAPKNSKLQTVSEKFNIKFYPIQFKHKFFKVTSKRQQKNALKELIKTEQFDAIHVNGSADHRLVTSAIRGLKNKPKVILTKHNSFPLKISSKIRARFNCEKIIAVSQHTTNILTNHGVDSEKIDKIYNGVNTQHFAPKSKNKKNNIRKKLKIPTDALVLGSVAGTAHYKGWHYLMQALMQMNNQNIFVVIAGEYPSAELIEQYVVNNNLEKRVIFTGIIDDVAEIIPAFDVGFVLSDRVETISFACREMMSCGIPVITSDFAGLPENILDKHDGWITPAGDSNKLSHLIQEIHELPKKTLEQMGKNARTKAILSFSEHKFIEQTDNCYKNLD